MNTKTIAARVTMVILLLLGVVSTAFAQGTRTITGTVSDNVGPVIGAAVIFTNAEGVKTGETTDLDGKFSIKVSGENPQIEISLIGYKTVIEEVGSRKEVNVTLESDMLFLDETVVIGYGVQQKSHLTGAIAQVSGEKLAEIPVSDMATALQGQLPGLTINNTTSEVGVSPQIRVRGTGSISAGSTPLIVIDGYPVADGLSMINPSDVKSIEVLKDAASAAIYGSRAANGVILITTKEGSASKPRYSFKAYFGIKYPYMLHDLMNSKEAYDLAVEEEAMGGPAVTAQIRSAKWLEDNMGTTDWQQLALRNVTKTQNYQFGISGGSGKTKYYVSAAYTQDEGIMLQNEVQKLAFRAKINTNLSAKATFGANFSANYQQGTRPRNNFIDFYRTPSFLPLYHNDWSTALTGYSGYARGSHFNNVYTPTGALDEDGNPTWEKSSPFSSANNNPRNVMDNTERSSKSYQSVGSFYFTYEFIPGLTFKTQNGYNVKMAPSYYYYNKDATKDNIAATAYYGHSMLVDLLTENTLNYDLKIKKHTLNLLAGYTLQYTTYEQSYMNATGFATDDIHTLNAATEYDIENTGTFRNPTKILSSFLARATYDYAGKYLLSASVRLDRSSLFTRGHRNAWFPSVSAGWRVSEEEWMKSFWWLNNLKVRASYGVTGNNDISYNATQDMMSQANYILGTGNGTLASGSAISGSTLANPLVTWEQTDEFNAGLDFSFLDNRINVSLDGYYSTTRALLLKQPAQSFTGFEYSWNNIGRVRNKGIEFLLETHNMTRKNFEWTTQINISANRNRLLEYGGESQVINLGERNESYIAIVGGPLIQYYGYKTIGIWNSAEEIAANPHNSSDVPGGLRVEDHNGDGSITPADYQPLGNPYPDFTYGMTNSFSFYNVDISFLIQGVQGVSVFNGDVYYNETQKWNKKYTANRWVSAEHPGDGKTPYLKNGIDMLLTDYAIEDGSYVCLRNVTIGYTIPKNKNRKVGVRVYLAGNNLAYIWSKDYRGINPESRFTSSQYSSPMISGYQRGGFPLTSTWTLGAEINF